MRLKNSLLLAVALTLNFSASVAMCQEAFEGISKADKAEAIRLIDLADAKFEKSNEVLAAANKQFKAINAKQESRSATPAEILEMKQQFVRLMDELCELREEHDRSKLKANRLLKLPDDSFDRKAPNKEKRAAFEAAYKDVRATMKKKAAQPVKKKT